MLSAIGRSQRNNLSSKYVSIKLCTQSAKQSREARRVKSVQFNKTNHSAQTMFGPKVVGVVALSGFALYASYDINTNKDGTLGKLYYGSFLNNFFSWIYDQTYGRFVEIFEPSSDKLLPDWNSPFYGSPPPGSSPPPLLVLDVERTLIASEYDAKHGWRHVKRPGLDKFLDRMAQYYEIVLFSENDLGVTSDILAAIDSINRFHKFGSAHAEARDGVMIKRLDIMNRDLGRIVLIDDNPAAFQLFPRNTLQIKPFVDVADSSDSVLQDLIPLLQALVHDEVRDFRDTIDDLGTHDAQEAAIEYQMRVSEKKTEEQQKRNIGLGGILRSHMGLNKSHIEANESTSGVLSVSQVRSTSVIMKGLNVE